MAQREGCLVFAVNGERFELPSVDPSTTLLEFLRTRTRFKSVKLGCGEGLFSLSLSVARYLLDDAMISGFQ